MTQRIYLFNPDNDLALAHGGGHYIAPPFAQKMQNDLCALPTWYAEPGSMVLVADEAMREWVDSTSERLGFTIKGITPDSLAKANDASFYPWGWSGTIKKRLVKRGVKAHLLPSDAAMEQVRLLAHRRNSIAMHHFIQERTSLQLSPVPVEYDDFNELLDIAQYSSNKKFVCEDMVNVGSFLKTIIGDAEEKNKGRLQLIAENTEPDDFTIKTNKIALCRVFSQLMDNAIKFTKSGSVTLGFHADKASKTLQFTVTDTGIGIPLAHQEKVFDRFYKVDMFKQGFGLGLPICRKVSELLGGTIVVDKDYVGGARFILTLPML